MIDSNELKNVFPIEGTHVNLKIFTESDITDKYLGWLNDPAVVRYSKQRFKKHTLQTASEYWQTFQNSKNILLAINLKEDNSHIGSLTINFSSGPDTPDIGILIGEKECWGQGIGQDAWATILGWLLDTAGFEKVIAGTLECNTGMIKIMINTGMLQDRVIVADDFIYGRPINTVIFSCKRN